MTTRLFLICLVWLFPITGKAQDRSVVLKYHEKHVAQTIKSLGWKDTLNIPFHPESTKWKHTLTWALANQGYLAASIELTSKDSLFDYFYITARALYKHADIQFSEEMMAYQSRFQVSGKNLCKPEFLQKQAKELIGQLENSGYPYAMLESRILGSTDSSITLLLTLDKGARITIDSFMVSGTANLHPAYLEAYLGIASGDVYQEKKIKQIDALLDRLSTIKRTGNTRVILLRNSAVIKVFIDKRSTDRFDGIVGFAPNSLQSGNSGMLFTGEVNFELNNLLGRGIESAVKWRKYLASSQDLALAISYPFVFKTPLFIGVEGQITRFDSLFTDSKIEWKAGIYQNGNRQWGLVYGRQNTSLITSDTNSVRRSGRLPVNNPMEINTYGFQLKWNQVNNAINPRSGFRLSGQMSVGVRNLKRDPAIDKVLFYSSLYPAGISIYDTLTKKSMRGEIRMDHMAYVPVFKNSCLAFRYIGQYLISQQIYQNELYRLGGFSNLQGFDERAIFANEFTMIRTEYRYLLNEESFAGIFINAANSENRSEQLNSLSGWLYGAGAHVQINTGRSSLQLAYALGTSEGNPLALRNAKFHFGLINYLR